MVVEIRDRASDPAERLHDVLEAYAFIVYENSRTELAAAVHAAGHVAHGEEHLQGFIRGLLSEAARAGQARSDPPADELANYCLHALVAAGNLPSKAAVRRLLRLTLAAIDATLDPAPSASSRSSRCAAGNQGRSSQKGAPWESA